MHLALTDLFLARWTDEIHDEWIRSVLEQRPDLSRQQLERTRYLMNLHVRDCLVTGYQSLIEGVNLPDPDDRHVLAAAIRAGADVIVTFNVADFPAAQLDPFGIKAQHPDEFILNLLDASPELVCEAARDQRQQLINPPKTVTEFLRTLEQQRLPRTVARLSEHTDLL